jgi:type I restriction enzyme, R subunit
MTYLRSRTMASAATSLNFRFLAKHNELLDLLGGQAERYFAGGDPNTALIKIRQFGEALAQIVAAYVGLERRDGDDFRGLLDRLSNEGVLRESDASRLFHDLRRAGNRAAHEFTGTHSEALFQLKMARKLAVWFHRHVVRKKQFKPGPFVPPTAPRDASAELTKELEQLRTELAASTDAAEEARQQAEESARLQKEAEARAAERGEEVEAILAYAEEVEEKLVAATATFSETVAEVTAVTAALPPEEVQAVVTHAAQAASNLNLNEAETRVLIDGQLRDAGWEVDSVEFHYAKGTRPQKGRNLAIAEWPTVDADTGNNGYADYVLFCGLTVVAVVEAKRAIKNVQAAINQAKRYSRGYVIHGDEKLAGGPWGKYKVPLLFSTNGRPFIRQMLTRSGIWYLDARRPANHPQPLEGWHSPEDLLGKLTQDLDASAQALRDESPDYLPLRDYQQAAVLAVETALLNGQREILLAMATGTGKTRTAIGLLYRLIKAKLFRRVLFLVDRTALGEQAQNAFKDLRLENQQTFTDIYDVKELGDLKPTSDTRLQVATVQGMVRRVLFGEGDEIPSVGAYDCVIIDEAHRGYSLDRDMTDAEMTFRDQREYVSKYRRVIDHFDAVRIGLTATPAVHTIEIFGQPVYEYGYRRAVIDGYLVDYDPPLRIVTKLAEDGIHWNAGEKVHYVESTAPDQIQLFETPDEVEVEIAGFNTRVHTENFNKAVCGELVKHIDPSLAEKTLIFCATDEHADMVVRLLKEALEEQYGPVDDDVVQKITGAADKPAERIRRYKNEKAPNIAVTVDLLTTGIDVPEIANIVFLRRIRSRILYEQMIGRATRLCPDIGKERFRIFDAVDLYQALQPFTSMLPVVTNPTVPFSQLAREVTTIENVEARDEFLDQFIAKLQRKRRTLTGEKAQDFETIAGADVETVLERLRQGTSEAAGQWLREHPDLAGFLDQVTGDGRRTLISEHDDEVVRTERGYGEGQQPQDYLESFKTYLEENQDRLPALLVVTQRPRDLTRQQLRELKLELDRAGYSEAKLQSAVRDTTNADVAARIIGFIRMELLESPLLSFEERVEAALKRILSSRAWNQPQRRWLELIAKQIKQEEVVDHEALDRGQFKKQGGGFQRLNKVFDGKLDSLLKELHATIWEDSAA